MNCSYTHAPSREIVHSRVEPRASVAAAYLEVAHRSSTERSTQARLKAKRVAGVIERGIYVTAVLGAYGGSSGRRRSVGGEGSGRGGRGLGRTKAGKAQNASVGLLDYAYISEAFSHAIGSMSVRGTRLAMAQDMQSKDRRVEAAALWDADVVLYQRGEVVKVELVRRVRARSRAFAYGRA
eukprot:6180727-Pleurochrysis_carterae.AAC.2